MDQKYYFYYDESEHSRRITKETINAQNFANNFLVCILGFESKKTFKVFLKYKIIEEKYKNYYCVSELKSSIISKSKYKYGLKNLKNKDIDFLCDIFNLLYDEKALIFFSSQNKIEFIVNQLLSNYKNDLIFDADSLRYSISKIINLYKPSNVIAAIYENENSFLVELKSFLEDLLVFNKFNRNKISENAAIKEALIFLKEYKKDFTINWNYRVSFEGFKSFIKEKSIFNYDLLIDKEGDGKTVEAAKKELSNVTETDSKDSIGIRMADIVAGVVSRFMISINKALCYKDKIDGQELKFLPKEWFDLNKQKFNTYKLLKKVVVDLNSSWFKTYCSNYSDDFLYFVALLDYFDSYPDYNQYKKVSISDHSKKVNNCALSMLSRRFGLMNHKIKIEPINQDSRDSNFYYNQKGAKCFFDYNKHKELPICETSSKYYVLSVGFYGCFEKACITVEENGCPVCYLLPDKLMEWAAMCVSFSDRGVNMFPSFVDFVKVRNEYFADIK